jgi:glycosyltransferase involved in cell wall biosynthesis
MLTYSVYETDARVRRYAETLVSRGDQVDVIALGKEPPRGHRIMRGVNIYVIQIRKFDEKRKSSYLLSILKFLVRSAFFLTNRHLKNPYEVIHVHNLPDFLVFATFFPKILGAKIILDIHDILPECYATKFSKAQTGFTFKLLTLVEKASMGYSNHVIVSNHIWQKTLVSRSVKKNKSTVILNYPDDSIFHKRPRKRIDNKFIMIYPGTWIWHQGIDVAIRAFSIIRDQIPTSEFHIYGGGNDKGILERLTFDLGLQNKVFFKGSVPTTELAEIIANADLGIEPKRNYGFANEALSTKIMEFMAVGIPVIASDTKVHRYYFNDKVLKFFKAGDENNLAESILEMIRNDDLRKRLSSNALEFVEGYKWKNHRGEYFKLIDSLNLLNLA